MEYSLYVPVAHQLFMMVVKLNFIFNFTSEHLFHGGALTIRTKKAVHTSIFDWIWQKATTMDMGLFIWIVAFLVMLLNGRGKFLYANHSKFHENQQHTFPFRAHCFSLRDVHSKYK